MRVPVAVLALILGCVFHHAAAHAQSAEFNSFFRFADDLPDGAGVLGPPPGLAAYFYMIPPGPRVDQNAIDLSAVRMDGNKSTPDTQRVTTGTAMAPPPEIFNLLDDRTFSIKTNWGDFGGTNALSLTAQGTIGENWIGTGETITVDGGFGLGFKHNSVGGRVGVEIAW